MAEKEYIRTAELKKRLAISGQSVLTALQTGRLKRELVNGMWKYDWLLNKRLFIESSGQAYRYTDAAIEDRLKRNPKSLYTNLKRYQTETTTRGKDIRMDEEDKKGMHPIDVIEEPQDKDGDFTRNMSRVQAEAVKQVYLAKKAKLSFLKDAGILIETAVVQKEWEEIAVRLRKLLLSIPDRVSEVYASMTSATDIHKNLTEELTHALTTLVFEINREDKEGKNDYFSEDVEEFETKEKDFDSTED